MATESLNLSKEELIILAELLEAERARLLVGIRHAFHRNYREQLHGRLETLETLLARVTALVPVERSAGGVE